MVHAGGRPLKVDWHEDADMLRQAYREEAVAEVRTRRHALWLVRSGHHVRAAAQLVGADEATVSQWLAWERHGGLPQVRRPRQGSGRGRACWLSAEQQATLQAQARAGAFRTAAQARLWIEQQYGVRDTATGISPLLARLRMPPKRPRPHAEKASPEAQAAGTKGDEPAPCARQG
jgi:transposase